MARPSNRAAILDAFQSLIVECGVAHAALDAVADRADVSKGGLLYHFPTKAALFAGLVGRVREDVDAIIADAPREPEAIIRWYLDAAITATEPDNTIWRALLGAIHSADEAFDDAVRALFRSYAQPLEAVLGHTTAEHVRLVGDGLYLNALVGHAPPDDDTMEDIIASLTA